MPNVFDNPVLTMTLEFPREPPEGTPSAAKCSLCTKPLPQDPFCDHKQSPIQLPCGCVQHYDCIAMWFECQTRALIPAFIIRLSCFNCGRMIDHPNLDHHEGVNEPYTYVTFNLQRQVMVVTVTLTVPLSQTETCDPKNTTFFDPSRHFPPWEE